MISLERPGIDPSWLSLAKKVPSRWLARQEDLVQRTQAEFEHYLTHGVHSSGSPSRRLFPALQNWFRLAPDFNVAGLTSWFECERRALAKEPYDRRLGVKAFAGLYTARMIELWGGPESTLGPVLIRPEGTPVLAIGVITGCHQQAFRLARTMTILHRKGHYDDVYPIFNFIVRVLADYLGEPPIILNGEPKYEPIHNALFKLWREPEPEALVEICLAACDYHTQRCCIREGTESGRSSEFSMEYFIYTPLAVLLMFKLRNMCGLKNPEIDHPLMTAAIGRLPEEAELNQVEEESDDALFGVRKHMIMKGGYDEEDIFSRWGV